jgi:adenylate kinase
MDIVLLGIQGSGKGTQSKFLQERYGLQYFETGSNLRKLSQESSELGMKVKSIIEAGHLVPSEVVMDIINDFMHKLPAGAQVLFDGIPRKLDQADQFEEVMKKNNRQFTCVYIDLTEEEAIRRLTTRRICEKCKMVYPATFTGPACESCGGKLMTRSDDNPESIKNRLHAFFNETSPVINRYKERGVLIDVQGQKPIEGVTKELFAKLDPVLQ